MTPFQGVGRYLSSQIDYRTTNTTYSSNGETRTITKTSYSKITGKSFAPEIKTCWNIKYNTDGDNCFTFEEQVQAMERHYSLSLTPATKSLLKEQGLFSEIWLDADLADDNSLKSKNDKMTKTFEAKMHEVYTKIADMGLLNHNKSKASKLKFIGDPSNGAPAKSGYNLWEYLER